MAAESVPTEALQAELARALATVATLRRDNELLGEQLMDAREKQSEIHHANELLTSEMHELTERLFQEANVLVATEARRRNDAELARARMAQELAQARVLLKNEHDQVQELRQKLEALSDDYVAPSSENIEVLAMHDTTVPPVLVTAAGTAASLPQPEPRVYGEFVLFLQQLALAKTLQKTVQLPYVRRCIEEDVEPAMLALRKLSAARVVEALMDNRLFIEAVETTGPSGPDLREREAPCAACDHHGEHLAFRYRLEDNSRWRPIDAHCREVLVAVGDIFTFLRHLRLGLYASHSSLELYYELARLRRQLLYVRLGFRLPDGARTHSGSAKHPDTRVLAFFHPMTAMEAALQKPTTLLGEVCSGDLGDSAASTDSLQRDWSNNLRTFRFAMANFMRRSQATPAAVSSLRPPDRADADATRARSSSTSSRNSDSGSGSGAVAGNGGGAANGSGAVAIAASESSASAATEDAG